jgi:hypothetical protein
MQRAVSKDPPRAARSAFGRWVCLLVCVAACGFPGSQPPVTNGPRPTAVALGEFPVNPREAERRAEEVLRRRGFRGPEGAGFTLSPEDYSQNNAYPHDERVSFLFRGAALSLTFYRAGAGTSVVATAKTRVHFASAEGREFTELDLSALTDNPDTRLLYAEVYQAAFEEISQNLRGR